MPGTVPDPNSFPQYPDVPFSEADPFTPILAYLALKAPLFTDQDYLGHRAKLTDDEMSDSPGAIKGRLGALESGLKLSVDTGRTVLYASGTALKSDGSLVAVPAGSFIAPASTTTFVWFDEVSGTVATGPTPPNLRGLIGRVVASVGSISVLEDLRSPGAVRVLPTAGSIKVLGGQSTLDKTCIQGETLDRGVYYFRNFTVPTGVTINIPNYTRILCSGNVLIQGTINIMATVAGAPLISGISFGTNSLTGTTGQGLGAFSQPYGYGSQPYGSGGSSGIALGLTAVATHVTFPKGGNGASGLTIEASGTIQCPGSITARGQNGADFSTIGGAHGTTTNFAAAVSGSGGGSGGHIGLYSRVSVEVTGTLDVRGGDGGPGWTPPGYESYGANGGLPGSGGVIVIQAPTILTSGATYLLDGGSYGTWTNWTYTGSNFVAKPSNTGVIGNINGGAFAVSPFTHTGTVAGVTLGNQTADGIVLTSSIIPVG